MMGIVDLHTTDIKKLCDTHNVETLYLFGSALKSNFNSKSDIDLLVKFKSIDLAKYYDNYMDLKVNLEKLLGRKIDLLEEQTLRNPILIRSINQSKTLLYG